MLSLEIIAALGFLYGLLMYAMLRTQQAKKEVRRRPKIREMRLVRSRWASRRPAPVSIESRAGGRGT